MFVGATFEHADWWHNGFPSHDSPDYAAWTAEGSPAWPNGGYERTIELSDTIGFVASGGCAVQLWKNVELEADVRYMKADVDANYTLSYYGRAIDERGPFTFPMDNWATQISLKYLFL